MAVDKIHRTTLTAKEAAEYFRNIILANKLN